MEHHYRLRFVLIAFTGALALSACSGDGATSTTTVPSPTPVDTISPSEDALDADVPDEYLAAVVTDVATRTDLPQEDFTLLDATAVEWASQRLGCVHLPEPSEPVPVDGYRVVVDTGEAQYDYRLDADGAFRLCGDAIEADHGHHDEQDEDDGAPEESTS